MPALSSQRIFSALKTALIYALIFILAGFLGNLWMSRNQVSGIAPAISGLSLDGKIQNIQFSANTKPVLLYFFAEWCPICKVQHGVIRSIAEDYQVMGIAMQSGDLDQVKEYAKQQDFTFLVINDGDGRISREYGVNGVPASFIIDKNGAIQFSTQGYASEIGLLTRLWLSELES